MDLHPESPTCGYITSTPKPGWQNFDLAGAVRRALDVPVGFDTDVNGAALGETRWGAAQGLRTPCTSPSAPASAAARMVGRAARCTDCCIPRWATSASRTTPPIPFPGDCPFHGDCLEGLASGPAMEGSLGQPARELPDRPPGVGARGALPRARAEHLGLHALAAALRARRRRHAAASPVSPGPTELCPLLNGYIRTPAILEGMDRYVVPPRLGGRAGVLGALILAEQAYQLRAAMQHETE